MGRYKGKDKVDGVDEVDSGNPRTTTTVHITGLPSTLNSSGLQAHASSLGPVRSAFVVTDHATSASRGFGYVKYVLRSDAEKAVGEGLDEVDGYKLTVQWAKKRLAPDERSKEKPVKEGKSRSEKRKSALPHLPKDPKANRTVVLQGLPVSASSDSVDAVAEEGSKQDDATGGINTKSLYKKVRKLGVVESVVYPAPTFSVSGARPSTGIAHIVFENPTQAALALPKLHGHVFKGCFLTAAMKARADALTRLGHAHGGRLIVRNVDFGVREDDLRWAFAPFGAIHSIDVPLAEAKAGDDDQPSRPRGRGFAFVWFLAEQDAARAIEGLNGKRLSAGAAAEKIGEDREGLKKSEKRKRSKAETGEVQEKGRVMAVDWALSKKAFAEAEAEGDGAEQDDVVDGDTDVNDSDGSENGTTASEEGDENDRCDPDEEDEEDEDEDESEGTPSLHDSSDVEDDEIKNADAEDVNSSTDGNTLFVRNLAFDVTDDQLYGMFRTFGSLRYARVVIDGQTKRSRGTGFICFWKKEDAGEVLRLAEKVEREGAGKGPTAANGQPSILQADPSSSLAARLSLHGRVLGVSRAVSKQEADKLREDRDKEGHGKDRRNLYLMREGVIFANSYEARGLHQVDLETRQQSFDQRKALLRTNPSLFISKSRLAVRQIPLFVTDKMLKRLARHALAEWRKQVKRGARRELSSDELADEREAKEHTDADGKDGHVKQAKILRQADRVDAISGTGRSKGYGFLELVTHADALRVLRWVNANPLVPGLLRSWHLEDLERSLQSAPVEDGGGESKDVKVKRLQRRIAEVKDEVEFDKVKIERRAERTKRPDVEKKPPRMLIVEFAIENAQTVKRRKDKTERAREVAKKRAQKAEDVEKNVDETPSAGGKRKRSSDRDTSSKRPKADSAKLPKTGSVVGGIIGRKRRQRTAARKA